MLLLLGYWRHVVRRFPLRYDPGFWGLVFPLGMYTVATFKLASAIDAPFLLVVPRVFVWLALTAWTLVFIGLLRTIATLASKFPRAGCRFSHAGQVPSPRVPPSSSPLEYPWHTTRRWPWVGSGSYTGSWLRRLPCRTGSATASSQCPRRSQSWPPTASSLLP